jgi:head-tail adaptor
MEIITIYTVKHTLSASTIDDTVEYAQANDISDDDFRIAVNNALCDILGVDEPDLL